MPSPYQHTLHEFLIKAGFIPVTSVLTTTHPDLNLTETPKTIRNIVIKGVYHVLVTDDEGMIWMILNSHLLTGAKEQIVSHFSLTWLSGIERAEPYKHLPSAT